MTPEDLLLAVQSDTATPLNKGERELIIRLVLHAIAQEKEHGIAVAHIVTQAVNETVAQRTHEVFASPGPQTPRVPRPSPGPQTPRGPQAPGSPMPRPSPMPAIPSGYRP